MNMLSPICRLPPELLATIFIHRALDHYNNNQYGFTWSVPSWVNISYVCRYWRQVALECPTLWAYHFVVSPRWTEELLARSNETPLKICLRLKQAEPNSWWLAPVERLMNHVEHIGELSLYLLGSSSHHILSILSSPAPYLRNLKILILDSHSEQLPLPFRGDTPILHTLNLSHCPVPWYSFKSSALTTLHLFRIPVQFRQSMVEFLATLSGMQELTELYLGDVLASAAGFLSSAAFRTFQKFDLPHLTRLSIRAPLSTVIVWLSCVNTPLNSQCRLQLDCCSEDDPSPIHFSLLSSVLAERFSISEDQSLSQTFQSFIIDSATGGTTSFSFSLRERNCVAHGLHPIFEHDYWRCALKLIIRWSEPVMDHIISDICCAIPSPNVQTLHVKCPQFSPAFWRKIFGHLQDLRYIKLSYGNMPDLASILCITHPTTHEDVENQMNDRDRDHILVPGLEELELAWIDFLPAITQRSLYDALSTRGVPRGRLTMTKCKIVGSGRLDIIRSWDGLINIVVNESNSLSYMEFGFEGDSEGDSEDTSEDSSEDNSEDNSEGSSEGDLEGDSEGGISESDLDGDSEGASQATLEGDLEDGLQDDSDGDLEGDSGDNSGGGSGGGLEGNGDDGGSADDWDDGGSGGDWDDGWDDD